MEKFLESIVGLDQDRLAPLVRQLPVPVAMFDRGMRYVEASRPWCEVFALDRSILGKSYYDVFPEIPEQWREFHRQALAGERLEKSEDYFDRPNGVRQWLRWQLLPWGRDSATLAGILIFVEDHTARKAVEGSLLEEHAKIQAFFEAVGQAIFVVDGEGKIKVCNRMVEEMFGYGRDELAGMPLDVLIPASHRERHERSRRSYMISPGRITLGVGVGVPARHKGGRTFPVELSLNPVETSEGPLVVTCVSDISVRKAQEDELRRNQSELRDLNARLLAAEEDAARRIAQELHDDIAQRLAFLSMEIGTAAGILGGDAPKRLRGFQAKLQEISESVRRVSHEMHPVILEHLGLVAGVESLCSDLDGTRRAGTRFSAADVPDGLPQPIALCVYRVCQESLLNAWKHSKAQEIEVSLYAAESSLTLTVRDTGIGFVAAPDKRGLGILSMRERLRSVGGTLSVDSEVGRGTLVTAWVPIPAA